MKTILPAALSASIGSAQRDTNTRLLRSAVYREVRLFVAGKIQFGDRHRAVDRLLEYCRLDRHTFPDDLLWQRHIYGNNLHCSFQLST